MRITISQLPDSVIGSWPAVAFLEEFPQGAPIISGDIRGKGLVRFPHTLLYAIEENEVVILAVAHQRQDRQPWLEIIRGRRSGV